MRWTVEAVISMIRFVVMSQLVTQCGTLERESQTNSADQNIVDATLNWFRDWKLIHKMVQLTVHFPSGGFQCEGVLVR